MNSEKKLIMTTFTDEFEKISPECDIKSTDIEKYAEINLDNTAITVARDLDSFPDDLKDEALERYKLLCLIQKDLIGGWTSKNLDPLIEKYAQQVNITKPSWRTVARWWQKYKTSEGEIVSLVTRNHKKGNSKLKIIGDEKFFDEALEVFLSATRPSVRKAYEYYHDRIVCENENIISGKIPIVSERAFYKRINNLPPYQVALARHGKHLADCWYDYYSAHEPPTRVLQRVEIDHTPIDLILIDDNLFVPIGRPYLTLLYDVFSSCIIGFHISFRAPGYEPVRKAILHSIKPKDYIKDKYPQVIKSWPCQGKIENLNCRQWCRILVKKS
ncbi:hypothetical protein [Dongshaea marina]|uniref:hypothetical protein n=1 Tax=Dongshaea marina TaxID=2047966 RepID=UPI000D3ED591|nr:hypothetical protein [Dongshaea marina]